MAEAPRDQNHVPAVLFESSTSPGTVLTGKIDQITGRILVDSAGGSGDVSGPGSSTDNAVVRWDGTAGTSIQNSTVGLSDGGILAPITTDTAVLGSASLMWSDLFLASGAVINFNNGNVALTHTAGILTMTAGELRITSANVGTNADSVPTLSSTSTFTNKTFAASSDVLGPVTMTLGSDASYDMYYRGATGLLTRLANGSTGQFLAATTSNAPSWGTPAGSGDVVGPGSSTDNAVARFDGTTGKLLQNSTLSLGDSGPLAPFTDDTVALGDATHNFSDLFLASGALINIANGNWVATHTSGILTVGTGDLRVTTAGTNAASVVTVGGAQTLTSKVLTSATITTKLSPTSDDGAPLGDTTHNFSDLFLASGGVINWVNGDVTITHSTNVLAFAGASSGYTFDAVIQPSANDAAALGAATVSWSDLFLASGAVLNYANGNVVLTHTSGILTMGTGELRITSANVGTNADSVPTLSSTSTLTNKTLTAPTLGGVTSLADGATIKLIVPTVDGTATGPTTAAFVSGYTSSAIGDLVILDSSGKWQKTDANTASIYNGLLGIALAVAATDAALLVALPGSIVYATAFPTMTIGAAMYMSETVATITATAPTTTDAATRLIGYAVHADKIFFNPSNDWITHT
jgi:hypothetical protein